MASRSDVSVSSQSGRVDGRAHQVGRVLRAGFAAAVVGAMLAVVPTSVALAKSADKVTTTTDSSGAVHMDVSPQLTDIPPADPPKVKKDKKRDGLEHDPPAPADGG